jgi:hypothetical protein
MMLSLWSWHNLLWLICATIALLCLLAAGTRLVMTVALRVKDEHDDKQTKKGPWS